MFTRVYVFHTFRLTFHSEFKGTQIFWVPIFNSTSKGVAYRIRGVFFMKSSLFRLFEPKFFVPSKINPKFPFFQEYEVRM